MAKIANLGSNKNGVSSDIWENYEFKNVSIGKRPLTSLSHVRRKINCRDIQ
jgi:hypothetical protein